MITYTNNIFNNIHITNIINIIKLKFINNINEIKLLLLDDANTRNTKIKKYIYQNRNLIYYITIISISLAILTSQFENNYKINIKYGGFINITPTDMFGFLGSKFKSVSDFFVNRLKAIFYIVLTFIMIGFIIITPGLIYLLLIYLMFKLIIKGGMKY